MSDEKKVGRPPKNPALGAMTAAERKKSSRRKISELGDSHETWTEAQCLYALQSKILKNSETGRRAWIRLGIIHKFMTVTN